MAVAQAAGIPIEHVTPVDYASTLKPLLPFGQLPYLIHGDLKVAQANAILRYVAKLGGLDGDTSAEFCLSNMLIEEGQDILTLLLKANGAPDQRAGYIELFARDGTFAKQAAFLEALIPGGEQGPYFTQGSKRLAGEYCIACFMDCALRLDPNCLNATSKLKQFTEIMVASPAFDSIRDYRMYLTFPDPPVQSAAESAML